MSFIEEELKDLKDIEKCRFTFEGMSSKVEKGLELQNCWILDVQLRQEAIKIAKKRMTFVTDLKRRLREGIRVTDLMVDEAKKIALNSLGKDFLEFFNIVEEDLQEKVGTSDWDNTHPTPETSNIVEEDKKRVQMGKLNKKVYEILEFRLFESKDDALIRTTAQIKDTEWKNKFIMPIDIKDPALKNYIENLKKRSIKYSLKCKIFEDNIERLKTELELEKRFGQDEHNKIKKIFDKLEEKAKTDMTREHGLVDLKDIRELEQEFAGEK